ncbi:MAG: hypothetical protein KTQ12_08880 [Dermatophilaceae bacterium]|jgi:hypothetical protein|nr:hypothetical protein [Dermatophilaceae bacterium]
MAYDLPGVYYRPDRGWSPRVRGLVGAQIHGDERMAHMVVNGMTRPELCEAVVNLAGLAATLLAIGPWGDGCLSEDDVVERWDVSTARLVAELSGYELGEGE